MPQMKLLMLRAFMRFPLLQAWDPLVGGGKAASQATALTDLDGRGLTRFDQLHDVGPWLAAIPSGCAVVSPSALRLRSKTFVVF